MRYENIQILVLSTAALFILVTGFIIYFVILYRNKQIRNKQEKEQLQARYSQEILRAQIEMQDQTLNYISGEIHDNITQVLSFVKLSLAMPANLTENDRQLKINESRELIGQTINDLRDLSKSLSYEHITSLGLLKTIEIEVERIKKSGLLNVTFLFEGEPYSLGSQPELVLFRIFQEALNNTLKHASAKHLKISLQYFNHLFNLTLEDDGDGFSKKLLYDQSGSGLKNIENRAALIGAVATIESSPGNGCCIKVTLNPLEQQVYADGNYSNSPG
ncbi:MAG TPA: ATP-binding protein [Mucilaginibacter sp.]|jgi:signal transduction histidine kinase|nr:ATP-binding protein [Mucilaginibacter sp.]